jgi:hypothetical protein
MWLLVMAWPIHALVPFQQLSLLVIQSLTRRGILQLISRGLIKCSTMDIIPCYEKSDDLTIEFNGFAYTAGYSNDGFKIMLSLAVG